VSGHACIAAELTATDDAVRDVSLQGVPVSQSDAQALIRRDNNKAQLNLDVVFVSPRTHRGKNPFESYAVVEFGRTAVRIVELTLQAWVDGGAAEFTSPVEVSLLDGRSNRSRCWRRCGRTGRRHCGTCAPRGPVGSPAAARLRR
jgi:hypothetical protein